MKTAKVSALKCLYRIRYYFLIIYSVDDVAIGTAEVTMPNISQQSE